MPAAQGSTPAARKTTEATTTLLESGHLPAALTISADVDDDAFSKCMCEL